MIYLPLARTCVHPSCLVGYELIIFYVVCCFCIWEGVFFFLFFFFFFVCLFVCLFVYLILFVFVLHFVSNVSRVAQLFILDFPFQFSLSIDKRAILRLCRINSTCVVRLLMMFLKTTHSLNLF
jgi:hypothetical protein